MSNGDLVAAFLRVTLNDLLLTAVLLLLAVSWRLPWLVLGVWRVVGEEWEHAGSEDGAQCDAGKGKTERR